MKKSLMFLVGLLVLSSSQTMAQTTPTCPGGGTVFLLVNGVLVPSELEWITRVQNTGNDFFATHPNISPDCVTFEAVYNTSEGAYDFAQSFDQFSLQQVEAFLQGYHFTPSINDPDYLRIVGRVNTWLAAGYRVVLVGHSQGTFFTNEVYERLTTSPPDVRRLSVVNIASAATYVNGGIEKYTTQCGDPILFVPGSLPANVGQTANVVPPDTFVCSNQTELNLHLLGSYLADGSATKQRIYSHLEASLPDPGCGTDTNCYLRDPFTSGSLNNFEKVDYGVANNGDPIITSSGGVLRMVSQPASPFFATGHLTLNTKRDFVGDFTVNLEYNSNGAAINDIVLVNTRDKTVAAHWALGPDAGNTSWYPLTFTKTNSQITMYVNGASYTVPTTAASGYFLQFDLQGNNTLQIRNFSVVSGATAPPVPNMYFDSTSKALTVTRGDYIWANLRLNSTGGLAGSVTGVLRCIQPATCAPSITPVWPSTLTLPSNGRVTFQTYFYTTTNTPVGVYNYEYRATLGGITRTVAISVTVTAPPNILGTVNIQTTNNVAVQGLLNGYPISAPTTVVGQSAGTKTFTCTAPSGYILNSITPSTSQYMPDGGVITFTVNLTPISTGTVVITTNGTVPSVNCSLNGVPVTGPGTFANQSVGTKTLSCTPPAGFTLTSITPSATQTLVGGGTISFRVNLTSPPPVLSYLTVDTRPKVNRAIQVTLYGSGFVLGMQAYVCATPWNDSCASTTFNLNSGTKVTLTNVRSSIPTTLYIRVTNSANVWSNYLTMVVIR